MTVVDSYINNTDTIVNIHLKSHSFQIKDKEEGICLYMLKRLE